jgi:hypothetical protein
MVRKPACRKDWSGITMGQQISAAWIKNPSAPTGSAHARVHAQNCRTGKGRVGIVLVFWRSGVVQIVGRIGGALHNQQTVQGQKTAFDGAAC